MLRLADDSYYTGITVCLESRVEAHESGRGSKYVYSRLPLEVVFMKGVSDRSEASKLECKIKKMKRNKKIMMIGKAHKCLCGVSSENMKICFCGKKLGG